MAKDDRSDQELEARWLYGSGSITSRIGARRGVCAVECAPWSVRHGVCAMECAGRMRTDVASLVIHGIRMRDEGRGRRSIEVD